MRTGSCRIWIGVVGRSMVSSTPRRRAVAAACSTACSTDGAQVLRAQVQQDEAGIELRELEQVLGEPVQPLELRAARLEELGAGGGIVRGALASSSLNVRSAAIGVRSSCETSARNSRLRSRSRRMISTLSWSRSAIALNCEPELGQLDRPVLDRVGGHAPREVALGEVAARLREAAQRAW